MENATFSIEVTRAQLRAALLFAADKDIRYYLNAVCLHVGECGDARLVATDGHRLAIVKLCDQSAATPGEYLMPRDMLKTVKKAGRLDKLPLLLKIDGASFQLVDQYDDSIICGARLIEGKFPDFQRVIPRPENMSGEPGTFNAAYLADIQRALIELGDKYGYFNLLQNGSSAGLTVREDLGLLCVVMGINAGVVPSQTETDGFMPRRLPRTIIVMADPELCGDFPREPLQDVSDKRTPAAAIATPAPDADYLAYLASMEADALQLAA